MSSVPVWETPAAQKKHVIAIPWRLVENIVARPGLNQFAAFAKVSVSCRRERAFRQKVPFCVRGVDI